MFRSRQTSIVLSETDVQYHLERTIFRQKSRVFRLPQPHVHRHAVNRDGAAFIDSRAHLVDSISDSEEPESISSSISDANTDTSLLQENNQGIRGSSPLPSNAKESQCGSHTFELKRTTMLQDLSRKENLTDRLHCNCKQCSLVNGNLHTTDRTSGL